MSDRRRVVTGRGGHQRPGPELEDVPAYAGTFRKGGERVLAVVVTSSGMVRDRMLTLDVDVTARELEAAANFLNERFRGWSIQRVRAEIAHRVERERSEYHLML